MREGRIYRFHRIGEKGNGTDMNFVQKIFGTHSERELKRIEPIVQAIEGKSATYRQFFGNRLFYKQMLDTYKKYGLMD